MSRLKMFQELKRVFQRTWSPFVTTCQIQRISTQHSDADQTDNEMHPCAATPPKNLVRDNHPQRF
jgi:hypothetical protein